MNPTDSGTFTYLGISVPGAIGSIASVLHIKEVHLIQSIGSIITRMMRYGN